MKLITIIRKDILQLFFVVLSFSLMVVVSYYFVSGVVEKELFANAQEVLSTGDASVRSDFREAEVALLQVEMRIENWLYYGNSYAEISSYMALLADSIKYDEEWVKGFMNVYGLVNDNFVSGLYIMSEGYMPQERPWYHTAIAAKGKIGITPPYIDSKTGIPVISFSKSLYNERGEMYGVIALDLDFSFVASFVENLRLAKGGYGLLCDENFALISYPSHGYSSVLLEEISSEYAKLVSGLRKNPGQIKTQKVLNNEGVSSIIIAKQIYSGWYLGIVIPINSYYRDVNRMALILSLLGGTLMSILLFILIQLSLSKARAEEENVEKTSFLARMSHEIRTPMNSILGMAELIKRKAVSDEIHEYIEIIHQSGDNLLSIINDILDFSKIESKRLQIENRNYQIASVVNDMVNMIRPRVAEKSLDFFVNVDSTIPSQLFGDDMRLRQILTNLLSNAVKYTRKGFVFLDVAVERVDSGMLKLICSVGDSGIGIKPEDQKRLFKEFIRLEAKANQGVEGTGLGLVITRALCRAMGGDITVTSEFGIGSVFRAVIIQDFENEEPVAVVVKPETKRVLFYDWRPQLAQSIANALESMGVRYTYSQEFKEFLKELEHGEYDYAFISSKFAMDCSHIPGMRENPLQLVVMVEPGEVSVYREVISTMMPVYSITLANVLNNVSGENLSHDNRPRIQFIAPTSRMLIVDDMVTNLRVAKELAAPYGLEIDTSSSGPEALNMVQKNHYDLIFMDHMMPGMDGIETTAFIRGLDTGDGYYKDMPIIALTANALSGQREVFLANGMNDFLAKPIDIQKLGEILEKWIPVEKRMAPVQVQESEIEAIEIPDIPGIDVTLGLRNCGGSIEAYFNILSDFCRDTELKVSQVSMAFSKGDAKSFITLMHAIKGVTNSIGAAESGQKAAWLEKAAVSSELSALEDKTNELKETIKALMGSIMLAMTKHEKKNGKNHAEISDLQLDALKTALVELDVEEVNKILLHYASMSFDAKTKDIISDVEQHILMFEYEKAISIIDELF